MVVRTFQSDTFSHEPYFDDRGAEGYAQPLTERVQPHSRPIVSYYFPKGVGEHHYGVCRCAVYCTNFGVPTAAHRIGTR
jgi:hypothetical protein